MTDSDAALLAADIAGYRTEIARQRYVLAERDAEIRRLTAELDATRNAPVEYVPAAGLEAAMAVDPHRADGMILRVTDGKREAYAWRAAAQTWEQVP